MATKRDYYEVLGLERTADEVVIKKAYRKLALEYHPDRNQGDEAAERFREAQEAYDILSDNEKRSLYDQFGHAGLKGRFSSSGFGQGEDIFEGFQSIFEDFFGGGRRQRQSQRGRDLRYRMKIDFWEAVRGVKKTIEIERAQACSACEGSGCEKGYKAETCPTCDGRGQVAVRQGFFSIAQTCPHCQGEGRIIKKPCKTCKGRGLEQRTSELEVNIPAGVDTGIRLRLQNEGEATPHGGGLGDLYVEIEVEADPNFERDGSDLYTRVYIPFTVAVMGGSIEVPSLDGKKSIKISKHLKTPHVEILRNEGVQDLRSGRRGNLYVELHIHTPEELSERGQEILRELDQELVSQASDKIKNEDSKKASSKKKSKKKSGFFGGVF